MDTSPQSPYASPVTPAPAPVNPQTVPISTPPPSGSHTGMLVGILVAVLVIAAAAYYFFFLKNLSGGVLVDSPSPSTVTNPSDGRKTFTDAQHGFEFRYPADWTAPTTAVVDSTLWAYQMGPIDDCEGVACSKYHIAAIDATTWDYDRVLSDVQSRNSPAGLVTDISTTTINGNKTIFYNEGGICEYGFGFMFVGTKAIRISGHCQEVNEVMKSVLTSFTFTTDSTANWKTYNSSELGIEFQYPSEWNPEGGVEVNTDCFDANEKANIVRITFHRPTSGGFLIEGVNKEACTNEGFGQLHYAKSPSEISYKETINLGNNTFYLDFQRVNPGTHAFHAYLFGNLRVVPSLHFYYNPLTLNIDKEYTGNEAEYIQEKALFTKILSTIKFTN